MVILSVALALQLSVAEFHDLRGIDARTLRDRFGLSAHCEPRITAMLAGTNRERLTVIVHCASTRPRARSEAPPSPAPRLTVPPGSSNAGEGPWRPGYD